MHFATVYDSATAFDVEPLDRANPGEGQQRTCQKTISTEKRFRTIPPNNGPWTAENYSVRIPNCGWWQTPEPMRDSTDRLNSFTAFVQPVRVPSMNGNHRRVSSCAFASVSRHRSGTKPIHRCRRGRSRGRFFRAESSYPPDRF